MAGHARAERSIGPVRRPPVSRAPSSWRTLACRSRPAAAQRPDRPWGHRPARGARRDHPGAPRRLAASVGRRRARAPPRWAGARRRELGRRARPTRARSRRPACSAPRAGPPLFLTLQRNRAVVGLAPAAAPGARVGFAGSELVWQHYAGQGLQLQWLGTFGRGQRAVHRRPTLRRAPARAARRGPGAGRAAAPAARPGSTSSASTAAGRRGSARWRRAPRSRRSRAPRSASGDPAYLDAARAALGVFRTPPPEGVRVGTPAGAHYLIYSFAPRLRVLNGFVQSLNGLLDFARLPTTPRARALFAAGEAQLAPSSPATTPAPGRCTRPRASPTWATTLWSATSCARSARAWARRTPRARRATARRPSASTPTCTSPPGSPCAAGAPAARAPGACVVRFTLSKVSTVTVDARGAAVASCWTRTERRGARRATPSACAPRGRAAATSRLRAVDLAGNAASGEPAASTSSPAAAWAHVDSRLRGMAPRTILYTGKGGVGKTSVAAATARRCAAAGPADGRAVDRPRAQPRRRARGRRRAGPDARRRAAVGAGGLGAGGARAQLGRRAGLARRARSSSAASTASRPRS